MKLSVFLSFIFTILTFVQPGAAQTSASKSNEKITCADLLENFCSSLWAPPHFGNTDMLVGEKKWPIRLGRTENDIDQARYFFLEALDRHIKDLPFDIRDAARKLNFQKKLKAYIHRKRPDELKMSDLEKSDAINGVINDLDDVATLASWKRTEKQYPGWIRKKYFETSNEMVYYKRKHLDQVWSDIFVAVWQNEEKWLEVKNIFNQIRDEYIQVVQEDQSISLALKNEALNNLRTVKLMIPGENPAFSNTPQSHSCGIDMNNAEYRPDSHELSVCAGRFNTTSPLLTIAHELGHSFSLSRRLGNYIASSDAGKNLLTLWTRVDQSNHYTCDEWKKFKTDLEIQTKQIKPYAFEDKKKLDQFLTKKLDPIPQEAELKKLADRLSKANVRREINSGYLEGIITDEEILTNGSKVKNFKFLRPTINRVSWPNKMTVVSNVPSQFELFFTEEYKCQLDQKIIPKVALKTAIEQATKMLSQSWIVALTVAGPFSDLQEARDEEFAQDIEEDVVDAYGSLIVSRILKKIEPLQDRRNSFLASAATRCDEPSFQQAYPAETLVLNSFSNRSHSVGADRREKIMTPEIRKVLDCR